MLDDEDEALLYAEAPPAGWTRHASGLLVPERQPRVLRAVDLFCGCGGFSLGMHAAGINVVAAAEWDPHAVITYLWNLGSRHGCSVAYVEEADRHRLAKTMKKSKRDPTSGWVGEHSQLAEGHGCRAMVVGDISRVTAQTIHDALAAVGETPDVDVVFGGPPCQGMSKAGKQNPADPRNNLVLEFVRLADELGADVFLLENVPPLVTEQRFRPLFDELVKRAQAAGFTVVADILDAVNYGVPQFRRRAIVAGKRGEAARKPFTFPMPTHWCFVAEPGKEPVNMRRNGARRGEGDDEEMPVQGDLFAERGAE